MINGEEFHPIYTTFCFSSVESLLFYNADNTFYVHTNIFSRQKMIVKVNQSLCSIYFDSDLFLYTRNL